MNNGTHTHTHTQTHTCERVRNGVKFNPSQDTSGLGIKYSSILNRPKQIHEWTMYLLESKLIGILEMIAHRSKSNPKQ